MEWQPIRTAPNNTRVLVSDTKGNVLIARVATLRWFDEVGRLIDPPLGWMPLPEPHVERPAPKSKMPVKRPTKARSGQG